MSTYYRTEPMIKLQDIRNKCKVTAIKMSEHSRNPTKEVFIDSVTGDYMHFAVFPDGYVCHYARFGGNYVGDMLEELESIFNVKVISEYEENYSTQEE